MPEDVFVNRETELERFRTAAHPNSKPVLVLCGEGGVGKTALRRRMETECAKPDVAMRKIVIEWRSTRPYDYLGIMSSIADCHDDSEFADFRQLLARIE